jgi:hypothetical protein
MHMFERGSKPKTNFLPIIKGTNDSGKKGYLRGWNLSRGEVAYYMILIITEYW